MKSFLGSCRKAFTLFLILITILSSILLSGCSNSSASGGSTAKGSDYITKSEFLLNTEVTINLYDTQNEKILEECFDLISKYENIYSRTRNTSELYALNHRTLPKDGNAYQISEELADLLKYGCYYSKLSGGAFDITIEPLSSLWDFTSANPKVPSREEITAALPDINYEYLHLDNNKISFDKDKVGIDLGAIAKGYIADKLKEFLLSKGVKSAMINLGGNILCVGGKPDGKPFHVGIQKPFADRNEIIGFIDAKDLSVVSSGIYERYFTVDGVSYHHILNPKTGYPYNNHLISVTIVSKKSTDGDGLSTTCFALGLEKGLKLVESLPDTYAIFITSDYAIHYSKGFLDAIHFTPE
jgi:Membrane-associated lipoprotein involved in thiamine biosynthesis